MDGVSIADAAWQVTVSPAWGFVLTEAVDVPSGAQMLWRRPGSGQGPPPEELGPPGDASIDTFHDLFLGGWFVMFPNAGFPDDDRDRFIHGEATRLPWEVVEQTPTAVAARMTTPRTGFEIARRVELLDGDLVISTEVTNVGDAPTEYTYGEHPCLAFATFAGGRIGIEAGDAWVPAPPYDPGRSILMAGPFTWPTAPGRDGDVDLSVLPAEPDGRLDHACLALGRPVVHITAPRFGRRLELALDADTTPYALLWQNLLAQDGVFAVEPSSSPGRGMADARSAGAVSSLAPGESHRTRIAARWTDLS